MKQNKLIPELRFPEFNGEWEEKILEEVSEINPSNKKLPNSFYYIDLESVENGVLLKKQYIELNKAPSRAQRLLQNGDIIYQTVRPYQKNNYHFFHNVPYSYVASTGYAQIRSFVSSVYLYQYLHTNTFVDKVLMKCTGSNYPAINSSDLSKIPIFIPPSLPEQQKIATCLSSLDSVIDGHVSRLDLLCEHRRGLLQQLFPCDGERLPRLRFPEFENDGEWEEKKLGEVATFSKGKGISKSDINEKGILPCIRYGELYTHYKEKIYDTISFTNLSKKDLVLSQQNDVIIPSSGETQEDIATASCVMRNGIALGGDLNIIRTNLDGLFLAYYLNSAKKNDIAQMAQGISVVHLYSSQLKDLVIHFPSLPEQQKIAECLSSLDNLIKAESERIEQLKLHKKGLMQKLFPTMN